MYLMLPELNSKLAKMVNCDFFKSQLKKLKIDHRLKYKSIKLLGKNCKRSSGSRTSNTKNTIYKKKTDKVGLRKNLKGYKRHC